jgi:hypothetical protein
MERIARLGIVPGQRFRWNDFSARGTGCKRGGRGSWDRADQERAARRKRQRLAACLRQGAVPYVFNYDMTVACIGFTVLLVSCSQRKINASAHWHSKLYSRFPRMYYRGMLSWHFIQRSNYNDEAAIGVTQYFRGILGCSAVA